MCKNKQPIGVFDAWKVSNIGFEVPMEERNADYQRLNKIHEDFVNRGAKILGTYRSDWSSEWSGFQFWEFPDIELLEEYRLAIDEVEHIKYFVGTVIIGRRQEPTPPGTKKTWRRTS
jgi:hypothetical protein